MKIQGTWIVPLRSIGVPHYQTRCKWARTASLTQHDKKISPKKNVVDFGKSVKATISPQQFWYQNHMKITLWKIHLLCVYPLLVLRSDPHSSKDSWEVCQGIFPNKSKNWRSYKGGKIYAFCIVTTIGIKYLRTAILLSWPERSQLPARRARARAGFRKFSEGKFMHRARAARACGFDSLPSRVLQDWTLPLF